MARVLIIEDDNDVAMMYRHVQFMSGFDTDVCASGETVIPTIERFKPDICLVDLRLPGEDGVSIARRIRAQYPKIGLLAISGNLHQWTDEELQEAGFDMTAQKPIAPSMLRTIIIDVLRKHNCPCERNICLPRELAALPPDTPVNKTCSMCGVHWATIAEIHNDPSFYPINVMLRPSKGVALLQYNHIHGECGTTGALEIDMHAFAVGQVNDV